MDPLPKAHGCEQSAADLAVRWQAMGALILTDRPSRCIATHAIDRAMIIPCTSEAELDLPNQRVVISSTVLVNRFSVGIVPVTVRIISVGIVSVIRIGIVKERVSKIAKENKSVIEVAMAEPIAAKAATAKTMAVKAAAKPSTAKSASTEAAASAKSTATEATVSLGHRV